MQIRVEIVAHLSILYSILAYKIKHFGDYLYNSEDTPGYMTLTWKNLTSLMKSVYLTTSVSHFFFLKPNCFPAESTDLPFPFFVSRRTPFPCTTQLFLRISCDKHLFHAWISLTPLRMLRATTKLLERLLSNDRK